MKFLVTCHPGDETYPGAEGRNDLTIFTLG